MSKAIKGLKIDRKALDRVAVRGIEKAAATGSLEITCQTCGTGAAPGTARARRAVPYLVPTSGWEPSGTTTRLPSLPMLLSASM